MVRRFVHIFLMINLVTLTNCFTPSEDSDWTLEWEFQQSIDLVPLFKMDSFSIEHTLSRTVRKGVIDSLGNLFIGLTMPGFENEVINNNPALRCKIYNKIDTLFDSTFLWQDMEFKKQYSDFCGEISENISKKTFLLNSTPLKEIVIKN